MGSIESQQIPVDGDFNDDGIYGCVDIDTLIAQIVAETNNSAFDMTGDGLVNRDDSDAWLVEAGEINLGPSKSYLFGDATLDGVVDGRDFLEWNAHKFTSIAAWCAGDFNADGLVDGRDFLEWNANKFQSSDIVLGDPDNRSHGTRETEYDQAVELNNVIPSTQSAPLAASTVRRIDSILAKWTRRREDFGERERENTLQDLDEFLPVYS